MEDADLTPSHWCDIFSALEHMDKDWESTLIGAAPEDDPSAFPPEKIEQLLVYFLYRHLFTGCQLHLAPFYAGLAVLSVRMVMAIAHNRQEMLQEAARQYSAEIEYSDENIERLITYLQREVFHI